MMRSSEPGWVRLGPPVVGDHRRSLWWRLNLKPDAKPCEEQGPQVVYFNDDNPYALTDVESVELCAGREGDDAYVKIDAGKMREVGGLPNLIAFFDVFLTAEWAVTVEEGLEEGEEK